MQVTLFTKPNCQLCDAIKYELLDLQSEYGFSFCEELVAGEQDAQKGELPHVPIVDIERAGRATIRFDFPVKQTELRHTIHAEMKSLLDHRR